VIYVRQEGKPSRTSDQNHYAVTRTSRRLFVVLVTTDGETARKRQIQFSKWLWRKDLRATSRVAGILPLNYARNSENRSFKPIIAGSITRSSDLVWRLGTVLDPFGQLDTPELTDLRQLTTANTRRNSCRIDLETKRLASKTQRSTYHGRISLIAAKKSTVEVILKAIVSITQATAM